MEIFKKTYTLINNQELILRTVKHGDEKELIHQMKLADSESKFLAREKGELEFTQEEEDNFIESLIQSGTQLQLVAIVDSKIVGNCAVRLISNKLRYLHRVSLGFAICKDYCSIGIGSIMIQECINWCKNKDFDQIELEVVTENIDAIRLYQKYGFEISSTLKRSMKYLDGSYADEHIMILYLDDIEDKAWTNEEIEKLMEEVIEENLEALKELAK